MAVNYALTSSDAWGTPAAVDYGATRTDPSALQSLFDSTRTTLTGISNLAREFIGVKRDIAVAKAEAAVTVANTPTPSTPKPMNTSLVFVGLILAGVAIFAIRGRE
jgi:hypothetical protein